MKIERRGDVWVAESKGPLRPILCEGKTLSEAWNACMSMIEQQLSEEYERGEVATAQSLAMTGDGHGEDLG